MSGSKVLTSASITSSDMPEIISDGLLISATEIVFVLLSYLKGETNLMKNQSFTRIYILYLFQKFVKLF